MQKFLSAIFIGLFLSVSLFARESMVNQLLNSKVKAVNNLKINEVGADQLVLSFPFSSSKPVNPSAFHELHNLVVLKIELVYTRFKLNDRFNQRKLNAERIHSLIQFAPTIAEQAYWDFELIEQQDGSSPEECNGLFHGFIITFRNKASDKASSIEADYLESYFKEKTKKQNELLSSFDYKIKTKWDDKVGYLHDTVWVKEELNTPKEEVEPVIPVFLNKIFFSDSLVQKVFRRQAIKENSILVVDGTGSMSPYIKQVIEWLQLKAESEDVRLLVFFNDGDTKSSKNKSVGNTGGVYMIENNRRADRIAEKAAECMRNGSGGGENFENDLEAILAGLKRVEGVGEVVLVADNYERMRDYDLMEKINVPVRTILCGAEHRINTEYLDLARVTGGSVHTKESDVYGLDKLQEGQTISINEKIYLLSNSKFINQY